MKYLFIFFFVLSVSCSSLCFSQNANTVISSSTTTVQLPYSNTEITTNTEEFIQNQPRKLGELPVQIKQTNDKETTIKQEEYLENRETPVNTITPKK